MSSTSAATKTNGRSTRNTTMTSTKRSSRSGTPNQDVAEKISHPTPTKTSQQSEKVIKLSALIEEPCNKTSEIAFVQTEKISKSNKKTEENIEKNGNTSSEKVAETNGDTKTDAKDAKPKSDTKTDAKDAKPKSDTKTDAKDVKPKSDAKTNGDKTNDINKSGPETSVQNGKTEIQDTAKDENAKVEKIVEDKSSIIEIMDEPMLTLSEDDEKSSLHDSFDVECMFETSSPTFSPAANRSVTRRSQAKTIPTPETPKAVPPENVTVKASTSNGTNDDESITVDDSESDSHAEIENPAYPDVSSSEIQEVAARNSPFRRSPRIIENASLIANYSGSTTRDLSMTDANNTNGSELHDDDSMNSTKEGETSVNFARSLRSISGRKSVRPLREVSFRNAKRQMDASRFKSVYNDSMNVTVGTELNMSVGSRGTNKSLKRERSATPVEEAAEDSKRLKTEQQSTTEFLMNYIPSPMTALRRRFYSSRISSSTPKKTTCAQDAEDKITPIAEGYVEKPATEEVLTNGDAKKNWCTIM